MRNLIKIALPATLSFFLLGINIYIAYSSSAVNNQTTPAPEQPQVYQYTLKGGHGYDIESVVFTPDGQTLVTGSIYDNVHVWDLKTRKLRRTLDAGKLGVNSLAISPDGKLLVGAGGTTDADTNKSIKVWNLQTGKLLRTLNGHSLGINALRITPDGQTLVSAGADKTIKLWNLRTGMLIRTLKGHGSWVMAVAISPDGKTLASAGGDYEHSPDQVIRLWDMKTGKLQRTIKDNAEVVGFLSFSRDGKMLVSSGGKMQTPAKTNVWNVSTGKLVQSFPQLGVFVALSGDGQKLLVVDKGYGVTLWDVGSGSKLRTLVEQVKFEDDRLYGRIYVAGANLSPNGKTLAVADGGVLSNFQVGIRQISF